MNDAALPFIGYKWRGSARCASRHTESAALAACSSKEAEIESIPQIFLGLSPRLVCGARSHLQIPPQFE
jgi:hypothetical protein